MSALLSSCLVSGVSLGGDGPARSPMRHRAWPDPPTPRPPGPVRVTARYHVPESRCLSICGPSPLLKDDLSQPPRGPVGRGQPSLLADLCWSPWPISWPSSGALCRIRSSRARRGRIEPRGLKPFSSRSHRSHSTEVRPMVPGPAHHLGTACLRIGHRTTAAPPASRAGSRIRLGGGNTSCNVRSPGRPSAGVERRCESHGPRVEISPFAVTRWSRDTRSRRTMLQEAGHA